LHAGAWIAAVTLDPERGLQVMPGHLVSAPSAGSRWLHAAIPFPDSFDVAAIVDLDSHLVGVALRRPEGVRVLTLQAASAMVDRLASSPACRAVDVEPIPDAVRAALRLTDGVVVETVAIEAFASPPDLEPGDVLLQLAREQISDPEEFAEVWDSQEPGSRVRYLVSRGSRRLVRRLEMPGRDCRPDSATPRELPLLGAAVQWEPGPEAGGPGSGPGFRILHVPAESPAAAVGIGAGDVVVAVDGTPLAWPEARRFLDPKWSSRHVPVLAVQRGDAVRLATPPESQEE
jgi:S1-C subfamily serine protease